MGILLISMIASLKHFPTMVRNITLSLILKQLLKEEKINSHYQWNYAEKSIWYLFHLMFPCKQKLIFAWVRNAGKKFLSTACMKLVKMYISMTEVTMKIAKNLTLVKVSLKKMKWSRVCYSCSKSRIFYRFEFVTRFIWNVFLCYVVDVGAVRNHGWWL